MPFSSKEGKYTTRTWISEKADTINQVLDIGAGSGTYINLLKYKQPILKHATWIGVEAWEPYIEQYKLLEKYDKIISSDVRLIDFNQFSNIDLVILGDILEHMSKDDAIKLIDILIEKSSYILISIPIIHFPQGEEFGNPFEAHIKDDWSHDEVISTFKKYIKKFEVNKTIGIYWLEK